MVSVRGLTHSFGPKLVLNSVGFEVAERETLAVMGTSGGGKTTLLKCVCGLIKPTKGAIDVDGIDVIRDPDSAQRKMGLVFQSSALFDNLSVQDNILFGVRRHMHLSRKEQGELLEELLGSLGLEGTANQLPSELSGGMKKRVGIARALAMRPKVMLYDEPTSGLDPVTAFAIDRLIVDVGDRFGVTSIVVSHDVTSVFRIVDRIAFLDAGKLTFVGSVEAFRASKDEDIREMVFKARSETL